MRKLGRDNIVVAEGMNLVNFNKMIVLNDTAAFLWNSVIGKTFDAGMLKDLLVGEYEVDAETAGADAEKIVSAWLNAGIIEQ